LKFYYSSAGGRHLRPGRGFTQRLRVSTISSSFVNKLGSIGLASSFRSLPKVVLMAGAAGTKVAVLTGGLSAAGFAG